MKHYGKFLLILMTLCLVATVLIACGSPVETESQDETQSETQNETPPETGKDETDACDHANATVKTTASTCTVAGTNAYTCPDCGKTWSETLPTLEHQFVKTAQKGVALDMETCSVCGNMSILMGASDEIAFDAYCQGAITVDFRVIGGEAKVELLMDGMSMSNKTYGEGTHSATIMKGLPLDEYSFGVKNNGSATVEITNISVDGHLNTKGAVILEINKKNDTKGTYEDFFVYVRTSDPSGKYYIRYNFIYEYSEEVVDKSNSTANIDAFRVKQAYLVEVTEVTATDVKYKEVAIVLHQGEISLAVSEKGAKDFVGGYHGDDHMFEFTLCADGKEYVPGQEDRAVRCSYVTIHQNALINRCAKPDEDVMIHTQDYVIDSTGVKNNKSVEWLVDGFTSNKAYLQMFTVYRSACQNLEVLDGEGNNPFPTDGANVLNNVDQLIESDASYADKSVLNNKKNRMLKYSSDTTGISAEIGFEILDDSCSVLSALVQLRHKDAKDNKWYVNFGEPNGSNVSNKGSIWKLATYFDIDYTAPAN